MNKILFLVVLFAISCKSSTSEVKQTPVDTKKMAQVKAANLLIDARMDNTLIELPDSLRPSSLEDGYAIQDEIIKNIDTPQKGWKVAITNDALMKKAGISEPVSGPLFEKWISTVPKTIENGAPTLYGFEIEFAFVIRQDLPERDEPYTVDEVKSAIKSMHLAIEPVGTRYLAGPVQSGVAQFAADHGGNYSFLHGPAIEDWQSIDLTAVEVVAFFDDKEVGREMGSNVLGNPLNSLTWLANHLKSRGHYLKAGQWVTTGAVIGPIPAKPPVNVRGEFKNLGTVEAKFDS